MQRLRESISPELIKRFEKELGRETTLRLIWPGIVGSHLAENARLNALRGTKLVVSVPDRTWSASVRSFETLILEAVNRLAGANSFDAVEIIIDRAGFPPHPVPAESKLEDGDTAQIDAGKISNEALRTVFLNSASKYLARHETERRHPRSNSDKDEL
jgi:hypothetical protein